MWIGDTIYFLSDRNGPASLFSYDPGTKQVQQVIANQEFDLNPSAPMHLTSDALFIGHKALPPLPQKLTPSHETPPQVRSGAEGRVIRMNPLGSLKV